MSTIKLGHFFVGSLGRSYWSSISLCQRLISLSSPVNSKEVQRKDLNSPTNKMNTVENTMELEVGKENLDSGNVHLSSPKKARISGVGEEAQVPLYFAKLTENAFMPSKGSKLAAGYDLKSAYDVVVPKGGSCLVKTDIQIQVPPGTYGRVAPRSGLALKNKIDVHAGVIDEDYRGNVGVILFNHADEDFVVTKGDRIAQLICEKIAYPEIVELPSLSESERGAGGFGSTGKN